MYISTVVAEHCEGPGPICRLPMPVTQPFFSYIIPELMHFARFSIKKSACDSAKGYLLENKGQVTTFSNFVYRNQIKVEGTLWAQSRFSLLSSSP